MSERTDRREFMKIMAGAAVVAPHLFHCPMAAGFPGHPPTPDKLVLAPEPIANQPVGVGKGIHAGRVVWAHDPAASTWEGAGQGHWWEPDHTHQEVVNRMMSGALQQLTERGNDRGAWHALFRDFNQTHGNGKTGYKKGEKVAIKVNFVGCIYPAAIDPKTYDLVRAPDYMNTSPQMILSLLRQLVNAGGVRPDDISVGDPITQFPNQYYDILHAEFPTVHYMDHEGGMEGHPRTRAQFSTVPMHWSCHPTGVTQDYVPVHYAEAKYFINLANLKSHTIAGATLCGKNHFGSLIRKPPDMGYYDMHSSLPYKAIGPGHYRGLVDLMGHADMGGKTMLFMIDGLYSGVHPIEQVPRKWANAPFNGHWACSLLASQDPVAIDSVGLDFLWSEWKDYPHMAGADDYLHEAALADNPPSGTFYDPNHATPTTRLASLGVHEHWNSPQERQYSRNLDKAEGIELVKV